MHLQLLRKKMILSVNSKEGNRLDSLHDFDRILTKILPIPNFHFTTHGK